MIDFQTFVDDFATSIIAVDKIRPVAVNQRTGQPFQAGIGPHSEAQTLRLTLTEMQKIHPAKYNCIEFDVPYPNGSRQKCDLFIAHNDNSLFVECKLLRILGDNGKPNDNMLMHILSPYPQHRSALTDCGKLRCSEFRGRKAILIFGYEDENWPLEPAIDAFEKIATLHGSIGSRHSSKYSGLCHPVHSSGEVFIWEVS